jgi:hypothetical protein
MGGVDAWEDVIAEVIVRAKEAHRTIDLRRSS